MAEYIEREGLLETLNSVVEDYAGEHSFSTDFAAAVVCELRDNIVATIPAADVEPVKRGEWRMQIALGLRAWSCSECKTSGSPHWKRCPVCEAKMEVADETK